MGFSKHVIVELLRTPYDHQESTVRSARGDTDCVDIKRRLDKDGYYRPICFMPMQNTSRDWPLKTMMTKYQSEAEQSTTCVMLMILPYSDSANELENLIERIRVESKEFGLFFSVRKTKVIENQTIEMIHQFNFLGSMISNQRRHSNAIRRKTAMAKTSMCAMNKIRKDRSITTRIKIRLVPTAFFSITTMHVKHILSMPQIKVKIKLLRCGMEKASVHPLDGQKDQR